MVTSRIVLLNLALLPLLSGCVAVSLHSTRPVEVRVTERDTGKPVSGAPVKIWYGYTGYGVFYVLRVPKPASATTDERGIAVLPMADFFQNTAFDVAGERFGLSNELIRRGGFPRGGFSGGSRGGPMTYYPPPIVVQLTPIK